MAIDRTTQGTKVAPFSNAEIVSIYDARLETGYVAQIERYGKADRVFDFLRMPEREIYVSSRKNKVYETLPVQADIKIESNIATSLAGAVSTLVVDTDDRSATGMVPLQVGEGVIYPGTYTISGNDALFVVQANPSANTYSLYPAVATEGVQTLIPANSVLKIHGSYHGFESGQPAGKRTQQVTRSFYNGLVKTTGDLGGGAGALKWQQVQWNDDPSRSGFIEETQFLAEFDHDKKLDDMIFFNNLITNTSLTDTTSYGTSGLRQASKGLWNHAEDDGQELLYSGTWDTGNFYDYKELAISQLVSSREVQFMYGYNLSSQIEQAGLDWIQSYSGGTDLFMAPGKLGIDVKYFQLDGFTFQCKELESFRNAIGAGNQMYSFYKSGLMIPVGVGAVTIDGKTEQHPNLMIGYLSANGINRKRSFGVINGPTGANYPVNSTYDATKLMINTEYTLFVLRANQIVIVKPA